MVRSDCLDLFFEVPRGLGNLFEGQEHENLGYCVQVTDLIIQVEAIGSVICTNTWVFSSTGQSFRLITGWFRVRFPEDPPARKSAYFKSTRDVNRYRMGTIIPYPGKEFYDQPRFQFCPLSRPVG